MDNKDIKNDADINYRIMVNGYKKTQADLVHASLELRNAAIVLRRYGLESEAKDAEEKAHEFIDRAHSVFEAEGKAIKTDCKKPSYFGD